MTGFARAEGGFGGFSWRWELRSVNNRGLDVRVRLPAGMEAFEVVVRETVGKRFKRGSFNISLNLVTAPGVVGYRLNEALLDHVLAIAAGLRERTGAPPPAVDGLLRLRGVLEPEEATDSDEDRAAREAAMTENLQHALDQVSAVRAAEGARLERVLTDIADEIAALAAKARALAAAQPEAIRARVTAQLDELLTQAPPLPEDRLAQEIALMVGKADVREEIDRLDAHVAQAREIMAGGGAVGRRLDFLAQEFNREANTLCSKANAVDVTRLGLQLKTVIDQFREQVQNVE